MLLSSMPSGRGRRKYVLFICIAVAHSFLTSLSHAQTVELTHIPTGVEAFNGFEDRYVRYRPAFALNGFDCSANEASCAQGLGIKQVLEGLASDGQQAELVHALFDLAGEELDDVADRRLIARNTQRAQAIGFVALVTLLVEQNGYALTDIHIASGPAHAEVFDELSDLVSNLERIKITEEVSDDAVKWVGTLGNLTRFVDQYLALEQAYTYYGIDGGTVFSCETKAALLQHLEEQFRLVDSLGNRAIVDLDFLKPIGLPSNIFGFDYDEVQAGNWSMKVHATVGYAALAQQSPVGGSCEAFIPEDEEIYTHRIERAFRSTGPNDDPERKHHWAYQTGGGERFWAEGAFYFNYGLASVLPFWQTVRAQQIEGFDWEDPFRADWFLEPLRGYAESVDPNGFVPPLDDGNKIPMEAAFMMRWDDAFSSDPTLGERFAWIAAAQDDLPGEDNWLNILFLPTAFSKQSPIPTVAPGTIDRDDDPHQIILRRDGGSGGCNQLPEDRSGPCHYVLMNGEPRAGIEPGEGHEQSDQLQLLYYVDGQSFIMDAGYDNAPGIKNSTWNAYRHHNIMTVYYEEQGVGHGGLPGPKLGVKCPIVSPCEAGMFANHNALEEWTHEQIGRLDRIQGRVTVETDTNADTVPTSVNYQRTLFFIDDTSRPYLIDINAAEWINPGGDWLYLPRYDMLYHVNSEAEEVGDEDVVTDMLGVQETYGAYPERTDHSLYLERFSVEGSAVQAVRPDTLREFSLSGYERGDGVPALEFSHRNKTEDQLYLPDFTTVAFIQPQLSGLEQYNCVPAQVRELANKRGDAGVYAWPFDSNTIDVLIVRSAGFPTGLPIEMDTQLNTLINPNEWQINSEFVSNGVALANEYQQIILDAGHRAGFIRLRRIDETAGCISVSTESEPSSSFRIGNTFPNPISTQATIPFSLDKPRQVQVDLFDMLGRRVQQLIRSWMQAGEHHVEWDATQLPPGNYILRFDVEGHVISQQVTKL